MLRRARHHLFTILRRSGLFRVAAASRWRTERLLILCYHGVSLADEHEWNNELYVPPALFRQRLEALKRARSSVLPLGDALERLSAGTLPPRSVAITFDDGTYDFYARAFPLLREFGFPATVYLTTYYCHFQRPVFDTGCRYVLWRSGQREVDFTGLVPGIGRMPVATFDEGKRAMVAVRERAEAEHLSGAQKDDLLRAIAARAGVNYEALFGKRLLYLMAPDEVREVAAAGIDVQLHTHRHRTPDDCGAFMKEIDDNRASIESILGSGTRAHFCYPSGVYRPPFLGWLRQAGVRSATTTDFGIASAADEMLLLPRLVDTGNITPLHFEAWLTGVAGLLPHRRPGLPKR